MNTVLFKRLHPNAKIPTKAYNSAGFDLFPCESGVIKPGEQVLIQLGFASEFPHGYAAIIDDRSSTGKAGLGHMSGVIDSDYRGPWGVFLRNFGNKEYEYGPEKAIAQVLFLPIESPGWKEVSDLGVTLRGDSGFGSSDLKEKQ